MDVVDVRPIDSGIPPPPSRLHLPHLLDLQHPLAPTVSMRRMGLAKVWNGLTMTRIYAS